MNEISEATPVRTTLSKLWALVTACVGSVALGAFYLGAIFNSFLNEQKRTNEQLMTLNDRIAHIGEESWTKYDMEVWRLRLQDANKTIGVVAPDTANQYRKP